MYKNDGVAHFLESSLEPTAHWRLSAASLAFAILSFLSTFFCSCCVWSRYLLVTVANLHGIRWRRVQRKQYGGSAGASELTRCLPAAFFEFPSVFQDLPMMAVMRL